MGSIWRAGKPRNDGDRIFSYAPGMPERDHLVQQLNALKGQTEEIPLIIAGRAVQTDAIFEVRCPHDHQRILARAHLATEQELRWAIDAALDAQEPWAGLDWYQRAAIFYRAADLLTGPRRLEHIAAIMVNQSK